MNINNNQQQEEEEPATTTTSNQSQSQPQLPQLVQRKRSISISSNSSNSKRTSSNSISPSPVNNYSNSTQNNIEDLELELKLDLQLSQSNHSLQLGNNSNLNLEMENLTDSTATTPSTTNSTTINGNEELPSYSSFIIETIPPTANNIPEPKSQIAILSDYKNVSLVAGEDWYLINREWYRQWEVACMDTTERSKEDDLELTVDDLGPINNVKIMNPVNGELKKGLRDGIELILLPGICWRMLSSWYGIKGPTFERKVVASETYGSERVEFYPPSFQFQLLVTTKPIDPIQLPPVISFSSMTTITELKNEVFPLFSLDPAESIRFWRLNENQILDEGYILIENLGQQGGELIIQDNSTITDESKLFESLLDNEMNRLAIEQQIDGKWLIDESQITSTSIIPSTSTSTPTSPSNNNSFKPFSSSEAPAATVEKKKLFGGTNTFFATLEKPNILQARNKSAVASTSKATSIAVPSNSTNPFSSSSNGGGFMNSLSSALTRSKSNTRTGQRGLTGLQNLGNTCFMNSALQCMSNTKELQEYFVSGVYKNELNPSNPLGMNGQVAEAFGQVIERLWSNIGNSSVAPREFKQALSKFAPSFSGYGQQDSQELLAFLLDGTHEDLNRIKVKPATNAPDWIMGGGDKELVELARVCWEQYRSRNDSVIVDLFQGQYRSTVVCPDCDKVSITFDPFMYVTVNLPIMKKWSGNVFFIPFDPSKTIVKISLELPKNSTLKTAKAAIGKFMNCDGKKLIVAEIWKSKFYKHWYDDEMISEVQPNDDLYFFESTIAYPQPKPRYYGKTKPAAPIKNVAEEETIIITVNHSILSKDKLMRKYGDSDMFGIPFLLHLTRAQAATRIGIENALLAQYTRFTTKGEDLIPETEPVSDVNMNNTTATPSSTSLQPNAAAIQLPPTPPAESMDVDEPNNSLPSHPDELSNNFPIDPLIDTPAPNHTPEPLIRNLPFSVMVSETTKKPGNLLFSQSDFPSSLISLQDRINDRLKRSTDSSKVVEIIIPPLPGQTSNDDKDDQMNSEPASNVEEVKIPEAVLEPLLQTGDSIVTEWNPHAHKYFFDKEFSTWDETVEFIDPSVTLSNEKAKGGKKQSITIEDCLREFTKEERLGEDDTWYCPDCKKHQQATKKVEIWKVPDVLVFALKRFSASRYSRDKIDDFVSFPIDGFNIEPFVEGDKVEKRLAANGGVVVEEAESLIYDLYAVDNHYGGMGGGHYTAYAKNHENGKWYDFDDSRVSEISDTKVQTSAAYLLFYRRRTARPIGAKSRELVDSALQSRAASASASHGASPVASRPHSPDSSIAGSSLKFDHSNFRREGEDNDFSSMLPKNSGSDAAEPGSPRSMSPFTVEEYVDVNVLPDYQEDIDPTVDIPLPNDINDFFSDEVEYESSRNNQSVDDEYVLIPNENLASDLNLTN